MPRYLTALSIAGSDPCGGAGIQADLKTFSALGVYGLTVPTALTVQNTEGVSAVFAVPAEQVRQQLSAVLSDVGPAYIKIGMSASVDVIAMLADVLRAYRPAFLLLDPVLVSSSGHRLLDDEAVAAMRTLLFPLCSLLTPNVPEAEALTGYADRRAADSLLREGCQAVLIKGGHKQGEAIDTLYRDGEAAVPFAAPRIASLNTHGTGCTLSAAICAYRARGFSLAEAIGLAKTFTTKAIAAGADKQLGKGSGPLHPFFDSPLSFV